MRRIEVLARGTPSSSSTPSCAGRSTTRSPSPSATPLHTAAAERLRARASARRSRPTWPPCVRQGHRRGRALRGAAREAMARAAPGLRRAGWPAPWTSTRWSPRGPFSCTTRARRASAATRGRRPSPSRAALADEPVLPGADRARPLRDPRLRRALGGGRPNPHAGGARTRLSWPSRSRLPGRVAGLRPLAAAHRPRLALRGLAEETPGSSPRCWCCSTDAVVAASCRSVRRSSSTGCGAGGCWPSGRRRRRRPAARLVVIEADDRALEVVEGLAVRARAQRASGG